MLFIRWLFNTLHVSVLIRPFSEISEFNCISYLLMYINDNGIKYEIQPNSDISEDGLFKKETCKATFLKLFWSGVHFLKSEQIRGPPYPCSLRKQIYNFSVAYFNTSMLICNLARSIIGVRYTVREHFNVQTGCPDICERITNVYVSCGMSAGIVCMQNNRWLCDSWL